MQGCWLQCDWSSQEVRHSKNTGLILNSYKYTGTTGRVVAAEFLQGRCWWSERHTHGSATGSKHIQRCWHCTAGTARSKLWNINSNTCATGDCAASACIFKVYWSASFFPPSLIFFFFPDFNVDLFLYQELTAEIVRKAALTGAAGHDSLCDRELITQLLQSLCWTRAADSASEHSCFTRCCWKDGLHLSLPLHHAPFPAEGACDLVADFQSKQKQLTKE